MIEWLNYYNRKKTNNDCLAASMILVPDKSFDTPNDLAKKKNQ